MAITGSTTQYRCIFKFNPARDGNDYAMFKVTIFSSWSQTVLDEIVIGSNGSIWWGHVTHNQDPSLIKYYAAIIDSYVHFYAQPVSDGSGNSNYHLVVGQVYILGNHPYLMVNQNLSDLPSGATEITNYG